MTSIKDFLEGIFNELKNNKHKYVNCSDCQCCAGMTNRGNTISVKCRRKSGSEVSAIFGNDSMLEPGCGEGISKIPFKGESINEYEP